ncbi:hypothetical protein EON65_02685 [archaeon]|nr:MAG: hypothetical protein EON65_02685 [archaeon]
MPSTKIETENQEQPSFVDRTTQRVEDLIDQIASTEKPWFLKSTEIYRVSKDAAQAIPHGAEYFEKSLETVSKVTNFIENRTKLGVNLDVDKSHELLDQLDSLLAEQLVKVDDGFDHLRSRLAVSLRNLMGAIVLQKNLLTDLAQDQTRRTKNALLTRFELALEMMANVLIVVKEKYHEAADKVAHMIESMESTTNDLLMYGTDMALSAMEETKDRLIKLHKSTGLEKLTFWALQTAQPYVRMSVGLSQPYVLKAIEVGKPYVDPYVEKAKPYVEQVQHKVMENKVLGKIATKAIDSATVLLEETKSYCLPHEKQH